MSLAESEHSRSHSTSYGIKTSTRSSSRKLVKKGVVGHNRLLLDSLGFPNINASIFKRIEKQAKYPSLPRTMAQIGFGGRRGPFGRNAKNHKHRT